MTESTQPPASLTSLPPATVTESPTPVPSTGSTTTSTTTTTTFPPNATAEFAFSQVVFGELAFVIITNWGDGPGNLDGLWLSQGTAVQALQDVEIGPGEQAVLGLGADPPLDLAGMAAVVHVGPSVGQIVASGGELALHRSGTFDDPDNLIDYVAWGDGPHLRLEQATEAGIWDGATVEVVDHSPSISTGIYPATSSGDWASDLGG